MIVRLKVSEIEYYLAIIKKIVKKVGNKLVKQKKVEKAALK